jgi:hypothetical protein
MTTRPVYLIAKDIRKAWGPKINFAAKPYLEAMGSLTSVDEGYGFDTGKEVVLRFLCNASTFRGEEAKRLKAELKTLCGIK